MTDKIYEIAIVGGGAAGVMAALRGVLNNDEVILFPGNAKNKKSSRATWVYKVDNMPGFHQYKKAIDNPNKTTLEWLMESEFKDKLTLLKNMGVSEITKGEDGIFSLKAAKKPTEEGEFFKARYVVVCTGIMDVQPHFAGSIAPILPYANAQTVDYCLRCDGHHTLDKHTSIIGHNNSAGWVAVMLKERYQNPSMSILTNGEKPDFSEDVLELMELYGIEVFVDEIIEVLGDKKQIQGYKFKSGRTIESHFSFVALGSIIYNELVKSLGGEVDGRGYVTTNPKGMTNIDNLYVAGDLRAGLKKQIYTAWDSAVDSLDDINAKVRGLRRAQLLKEKRK